MIALFLPEWATGFNFIIAFLLFLVVLAGAVVLILATRRSTLSKLQIDRADAAEKLVGTRNEEIVTLKARVAELEEELEGLTAEHRALAGISIAKLMEFWAEKESIEASMADLKREIRILQLRKDGPTQ